MVPEDAESKPALDDLKPGSDHASIGETSTSRHADEFRALQTRALELAAEDGPLLQALGNLMHAVEAHSSNSVLGSVLLVKGDRLIHGAGPSLPTAYNVAIDGIPIGTGVGSCGTAAFERRPVYVADIALDALWDDYRELALSHGLRACWSTPIFSSDGEVLGTFAMYYGHPRQPSAADLEIVHVVSHAAALLIERRQTVDALAASEERLRLAVDNAEVGFWDVDLVDNLLIWPPRTKAMFGISADVPVSMQDFYDGLHEDDGEATTRSFAAAADPDRRALYDVEYRTVGKEDGRIRWVAAKGRGVFDEAGRCLRVIGTAIDITSRKRVEAELVASEARLLALNADLEHQVVERSAERDLMWRTSPDLLLVIGFDGVLRRVNPAWSAILGYSEDELVGTRVDRLVHPDDVILTEKALVDASGGPLPAVENRYRHKDGSYRWLSWITPAPVDDLIFATGRHVTAEKEREAQLEAAQEALRQSQKMEAVGQLTGGIAHDFNNMLAVVMTSLELLNRRLSADDPRSKRQIQAASDAARRAALLTQRLLAFSRQQPLQPEAVDPNKLVARMSDLLAHSLGGDVRLETVLAAGLWRIHADPNQLENVVLNLALNGRDAMVGGGRLTIETANCHLDDRYAAANLGVSAGQYVLIAVSDTGSGMPPDVVAKAFDPFFTTKEVGKGTGLGLSQVYGFIKQSGGHVKIYSEPGQGTTIKVYLPRLMGAAEEAGNDESNGESPTCEGQETILVVEDEPAVRQISVDALVELGYRVLEADGAAAALLLLNTHPEIALLFTDVVMPDVNGAKLAAEAKRLRPDLRVLFTTGYTRNAVVHNGVLDAGVDMIGKPFTLDELAVKVRTVLDAPPKPDDAS